MKADRIAFPCSRVLSAGRKYLTDCYDCYLLYICTDKYQGFIVYAHTLLGAEKTSVHRCHEWAGKHMHVHVHVHVCACVFMCACVHACAWDVRMCGYACILKLLPTALFKIVYSHVHVI